MYDEEIAPLFIPRGEILDKYERKIEFYMSKKDELNIKIKKEESKNEKSNKKRIKKWKDDLVWYLEEIERLTNEKNEVIQIIDIYYAKDKNNAWRLKEEYFDRLDETLLGHFKNGLLSEYVSTDVLIRKNNVISILDKFRKEIKWELNN